MREGNSLPICRVEEGSQSSQKQPRQSTQITQSRGKAGVGYFFASESSPNTSCVRGCGLMETYALNVGGGKRRGIPIACAQSLVSFWRS